MWEAPQDDLTITAKPGRELAGKQRRQNQIATGDGIAAHVILDSEKCSRDPQYEFREHFVTVDQAVAGATVVEGSRFKLQATPAIIERGPPATGEYNIEVLTQILGYDDDKLADVLSSFCME